MLVEKEQVALLAAEAEQFLDRIAEEDPEEPRHLRRARDGGAVEEDEPLFRARLIGIGYDPERSLVLHRAARDRPPNDEEPPPALDESEGRIARLYATRAQIRAMLAQRRRRGRRRAGPKCPLCDFPMDPDGHICPRLELTHA